MGGGGTEQTTQTSGSTNPMVDTTVTNLLNGLNGQMGAGSQIYDKPLHTGMGDLTRAGIQGINSAATRGAGGLNGAFDWARGTVGSGGYNPALSSAQSGIEGYLRESQADAPGYAAMRKGALDEALGGVGSSFLTDGRFGSSVMGDAAGEAATSTLAGMDYQNYNDRLSRLLGGNQALAGIGQTAMGNAAGAATSMPGLFSGTMLPGQAQLGAGSMVDADALAGRTAEADLWTQQNNRGWNDLAKATGILSGNAGASGQTSTTSSPTTPWWQQALGGAIGLGGAFL